MENKFHGLQDETESNLTTAPHVPYVPFKVNTGFTATVRICANPSASVCISDTVNPTDIMKTILTPLSDPLPN